MDNSGFQDIASRDALLTQPVWAGRKSGEFKGEFQVTFDAWTSHVYLLPHSCAGNCHLLSVPNEKWNLVKNSPLVYKVRNCGWATCWRKSAEGFFSLSHLWRVWLALQLLNEPKLNSQNVAWSYWCGNILSLCGKWGLYRKIGKSKNGNSVFSLKDMHCQPRGVLIYL